MIVISHEDKTRWNNIVKSFNDWDIYYLQEYAMSFYIHGDGEPLLLYYEDENCKLCYVVMKNDIAESSCFKGVLENSKYYDFTTPYGYGGPIIDGNFNVESSKKFENELNQYCLENNIISQFIRFHPLLMNHKYLQNYSELRGIKKTIYVDTSDLLVIDKNIDSKNRNMIRKAQKNDVIIKKDRGEQIEEFKKIYNSTMIQNNAENYYFFKNDYYDHSLKNMSQNMICFYAYYDDQIISVAMFYYSNQRMHYHLSGTLKEYRHLASMNLMIYEASIWAHENNLKILHLGGGLKNEDSLFKFKKSFNRNGENPFYIGRNIFNREAYEKLLLIRLEKEKEFNINNSHLIQYRKE